jgi:FkbM family methyltransferase
MDKHDTKNFNYISKFIVDGDVLVDVGAHLGVYSDFFLKSLNGTGKVYTLEPHPTNYDRLYRKYKNSDKLDSKTIVLENKAASDIDGIIDVYHDMGTQTQING